jgi:hypothetical protein
MIFAALDHVHAPSAEYIRSREGHLTVSKNVTAQQL